MYPPMRWDGEACSQLLVASFSKVWERGWGGYGEHKRLILLLQKVHTQSLTKAVAPICWDFQYKALHKLFVITKWKPLFYRIILILHYSTSTRLWKQTFQNWYYYYTRWTKSVLDEVNTRICQIRYKQSNFFLKMKQRQLGLELVVNK